MAYNNVFPSTYRCPKCKEQYSALDIWPGHKPCNPNPTDEEWDRVISAWSVFGIKVTKPEKKTT